MSDRKAVIKNADMNEEMQQDAVDFATQALEKFNIEKVRKNCTCPAQSVTVGTESSPYVHMTNMYVDSPTVVSG